MSDVSRIEQIFLNAASLSNPADREAYLDSQCGSDDDLRRRVEALLAAQPQAQGFLEPVTVDRTSEYQPKPEPQAVAAIIADRYTLTEVIGEGGMGTVWRAKQTEPVKRFVALKLIKPGMDSKQVLARFEAERQALAMMDHPNIAKILDGGIHDNRPFFVMELVKGTPITEFCDARKLTPRQRLELFLPVCLAIQHAHQKGIIHRDIKPSNVLIALYDDKPVPKVIDFGVAKATGGALTQQTIDTGFGGVVGTPQYMSPEQATFNNLDIDTRSDVYSLGTLLYELLAGSPPFARPELEKRGLLEILRVVREEEPPRPSLKLSTAEAKASISANRSSEPAKLSDLMRGEIDWIVMKALEKDRTRRYDTANGLAADVQRYLNGDAVEACPPTLGYRLKKAYRRNRTVIEVTAAFILILLVGVIVSGRLAYEAKRAEAAAENNANAFYGAMQKADISLQQVERLTASQQVDADLAEYKADPRVGLLRLAKTLQSLVSTPIHRRYPLEGGGEIVLQATEEHLASQQALAEFVTAAVLTNGQNFAPLLQPLTHDGGPVIYSQLSSDARKIITLGNDGVVKLWESTTASLLATLREKEELVLVCGLSPDATTAVTDDMTGVVRFWDTASGKLKTKTEANPHRYQFPKNWTYERLVRCKSGDFGFEKDHIRNVQFENKYLLSSRVVFDSYPNGGDFLRLSGQAELWNAATGLLVARFETSQKNDRYQARLIADEKFVIVLGEVSEALIYSTQEGRLLTKIKDIQIFNAEQVAVSPSGRMMVVYTHAAVRVWDTLTWKEVTSLKTGELSEFYDGPMMMISENIAVRYGQNLLQEGSTVWELGNDNRTQFLNGTHIAVNSDRTLACLDEGQLFDCKSWKRLLPSEGRRYHPDLIRFGGDKRFVSWDGFNEAWIDIQTDKACPGSCPWRHSEGFGLVRTDYRFSREPGLIQIVPTTRLHFAPAILLLWAQVAVRGELGNDVEFVAWNQETWEKKRQELATAKSPYADFPFPGYVAKDKLHWHRAEYEAAQDDKKKLNLANELLRRTEEIGDKNEAVRWQTERAKYLPKPATHKEKK